MLNDNPAARPRAVFLAMTLLSLSLCIGVGRAIARYLRHADVRSAGVGELIQLSLFLLGVVLLLQIWRGRHWGRVGFLAVLALAVPLTIAPMFQAVSYFPIYNAIGIAQVVIYIAGMLFAFHSSASPWFGSKASNERVSARSQSTS